MRYKSICCLLAALCCLSIGAAGNATAAPVTSVVFGNLESSGTGALDSQNVDLGPGATTTFAIATGFTTSSNASTLTLQSVAMGAFATPSGNRTVAIYSNNSGLPGTALFASSATNVATTGLYTFSFSNPVLSPNTTYWVVPQFDADWSVYFDADLLAPTAQNGSGWAYVGTKRQVQSNPGVWGDGATGYSVSIQAVPEPSTYALAALGLGVAGIVRARRRQSAV